MVFREIKKSPTLYINELSKELESQGKTIYKLGFGQSPFLPPLWVQEALQEAVYRKDYAPVQGLPELRENVASFHSCVDRVATHADQIIIGAGSKPLLLNSLLAFQNAQLILPAPSWVSYKPQGQLAGHNVVHVPTYYNKRWRITPDQLEEALSQFGNHDKTKVLLLNYPGNPDGLTYSADELEALAVVFRKHGIWVISDEIYGLLHHQQNHVSLRRFYPERTLVTTGLSKWCGAGGWRLGVQILPEIAPTELKDVLIALASETFTSASTPVQVAASKAYIWDEKIEAYLRLQCDILTEIGKRVYQELANAGIAVHPPEGGFYLLLDFSPLQDPLQSRGISIDTQLCEQILQDTGVALLPGIAFGMPEQMSTARLSYVDFNGANLMHVITHQGNDIVTAIDQHCHHLFEGIDRLANWVS